MRVLLATGIVIILLTVKASKAQGELTPSQGPPIEITGFNPKPPDLLVNIRVRDSSNNSVLLVTLTNRDTKEKVIQSALADHEQMIVRFSAIKLDDSLYIVDALLLDADSYTVLSRSAPSTIGDESQLKSEITKVELVPNSQNPIEMAIQVAGTKTKAVTKVRVQLTDPRNNVPYGVLEERLPDKPDFTLRLGKTYELGNIPRSSIIISTTLIDDAGNTPFDHIFFVDYEGPYLEIKPIDYDSATNLVTVTYVAIQITEIRFTDSTGNDNRVSIDPTRLDASRPMSFSWSPKHLFPYTPYVLTAEGTDPRANGQNRTITVQQKNDDYFPTINLLLQDFVSQYWYIVVLTILFLMVLVYRQLSWMAVVGAAPLALLPFQRQHAVKRVSLRLQTAQNLSQFYPLTGHPDLHSHAFAMLTRARQLSTLPTGFHKLAAFTAALKDLEVGRELKIRLNPIKQHESAVLERLEQLLLKDCSELAKSYWKINALCRAVHILPVTMPEEEISLSLAPAYLDMLSTTTRQLQGGLEPYATLFDQGMRDAYVYLSEIASELNRLRTANLAGDLFDGFITLERIYRRLDAYTGTFHEEDDAIKPDLSGLTKNTNPIRVALILLQGGIVSAHSFLDQYTARVEQEILMKLQRVESIQDITQLEQISNSIIGNHFGGYLDVVMDRIEDIAQEVSSALAQTPQSYGRRLALQDAHVFTRDLYAKLKNESPAFAGEVQRIAGLFEEHKREETGTEQRTYNNPYVTGNPIRPERIALFKGRAGLASDVVNRLRGGRKSTLLLYGARRMGKSSFLYHLENLLPSNYLSVFVDCQGAATDSEASFFYLISRAIYGVLRKREPATSRGISRPHSDQYRTGSPAVILEEWLRDEVAPILNQRMLLITLDEFEEIGNAIKDGRINVGILGHLRHMIQHSENVNLMFAGVAALDALVPNAASYFISVSSVELSYIDNGAANALIRRPYQAEDMTVDLSEGEIGRVPAYDDDAVNAIIHLTHNQPYLIQAMCEQLINLANEEQLETITKAEVERVAKTIDREYPNYFEFYWKNWGEFGQQILSKIAHGHAIPNDNATQTQHVIADMLRHHVINQYLDGDLAVEIPLMESFLQKRA